MNTRNPQAPPDLRTYLETARAAARLLEATIQTAGEQRYAPAVLNQLGTAFSAALQATDALTLALRAYDTEAQS